MSRQSGSPVLARLSADEIGRQAEGPDKGVVILSANQRIGTTAARDDVVARSAVYDEFDQSRGQSLRVDPVIPADAIDRETVEGGVRITDVDRAAAGARDPQAVFRACQSNLIIALGAEDDNRILRAVRSVAAFDALEVQSDVLNTAAGKTGDDNQVGAAAGIEDDGLDACGIDHDAADVARQPETASAHSEFHRLGDVSSEYLQDVCLGGSFYVVIAVARVPDEGVIARLTKKAVFTLTTGDLIVTGHSADGVVSTQTEDLVVTAVPTMTSSPWVPMIWPGTVATMVAGRPLHVGVWPFRTGASSTATQTAARNTLANTMESMNFVTSCQEASLRRGFSGLTSLVNRG